MVLGKHSELEALALGLANELPGARERAQVLAQGANALSAACACLVLAEFDERRGKLAESLRSANAGLTRLASSRKPSDEADHVQASLLVARGVAQAGLAQLDDATATHDELLRRFPKFRDLRAGAFRICLLGAARAGDLHAAIEIASLRRTDTPIVPRDAFLCEAMKAANETTPTPAAKELVSRMEGDPLLGAWLRAVAPRVAEKLRLATSIERP